MLTTRRARVVDAVPALVLMAWFAMRVLAGSILPIPAEPLWQATAAVVAATCAVAATAPESARARLAAGVAVVSWTGAWVAMLTVALGTQTAPLADRISWVGIWQYVTIAVLAAYNFGRRPHPLRIPERPDR